jgi:hypothetical protein
MTAEETPACPYPVTIAFLIEDEQVCLRFAPQAGPYFSLGSNPKMSSCRARANSTPSRIRDPSTIA